MAGQSAAVGAAGSAGVSQAQENLQRGGSRWRSYLVGSARGVRDRLAVEDWAGALSVLSSLVGRTDPLEFLRAYLLLRVGKNEKALRIFERLDGTYGTLRPWIRLYQARTLLKLHRYQQAIDVAKMVPIRTVCSAPAILVEATALRMLGKIPEAIVAYKRFFAVRPASNRAQARYWLAWCLDRVAAKPAAVLAQVRFLRRGFPLSHWTKQGRQLGRKALARLGPAAHGQSARASARWKSPACDIARMKRLMATHRYHILYRDVRRLARTCRGQDRCRAGYFAGQALYRLRKRRLALAWFRRTVSWCEASGPAMIKAKSLYQAGRSAKALGRYRLARAYFRRVEREHPHHSYADDAAFKLAESWHLQGKPDRAMRAYRRILTQYPKGDMRQEALWRIVRRLYFTHRYRRLIALVAGKQQLVSGEKGPHAACRILYWQGRALAKIGGTGRAEKTYDRIVASCPLTYYAWLSLVRLAGSKPQRARTLWIAMARSKGSVQTTSGSWFDSTFGAKAGFQRAVELARLGLGRQALSELDGLGLRIPRGKPKRGAREKLTPVRRHRLWMAAEVLDTAGLYYLSHWLPRHLLWEYKSHFPVGRYRAQWLLAYPSAYADLVVRSARAASVPSALLSAVMREESAFNPRQTSRARAVGLTQLLVTTARRFARHHRASTRLLKRPAVNLRIGARYLGFLLRRFSGRWALAVAAYNAGERRVGQWLKRFAGLEMDEFVEMIPYHETRQYTKRVLGSAFTYQVLSGRGVLPTIAWRLPTRVRR
ncbi:MAG: transglycosylase SLT domain-containing protein [Deltaproteobacteria bacterium]|nr:transglycosylase SLT domain-containing protein [Deltaproteobacteria bacterium]